MSSIQLRSRFASAVALITAAASCGAEPPRATIDAAGEPAVCLQGDRFAARGEVEAPELEQGDATHLIGLRWEGYEGCERFVIDLGRAEEVPADRPGPIRARVLRELGVVRIDLRDVEFVDTAATDRELGGNLARSAYAVRSPEGRWISVDVHLAAPAEVQLTVLSAPARVVLDLRPGGGPVPDAPADHRRVVVLEPRGGAQAYPFTVSGYARTFEANVVMRIEQDGEPVMEDFTTATGWVDAWGAFEFTVPSGPTGEVRLHVGEYSAKDGTWEGVEVPLEMGAGG